MSWIARRYDRKNDKIKSSEFPKKQVEIAEKVVPVYLRHLEESNQIQFYADDIKQWIKNQYRDIIPVLSEEINTKEKRANVIAANPGKIILDVQNCCYHLSRPESYWIEDSIQKKELVPLSKLGKNHYELKVNWKDELGLDSNKSEIIPEITESDDGLNSDIKAEFDISKINDEREKQLSEITKRQGQADFRKSLLHTYKSKCVITGYDAENALEAAHIIPYLGEATNNIVNGLLLRADIHILFDLRLLTIDPSSYEVILSKELKYSSYSELDGTKISLPSEKLNYPNRKALEYHFSEFMKLNK